MGRTQKKAKSDPKPKETSDEESDLDSSNEDQNSECVTCKKVFRNRLCICDFCKNSYCKSCQNVDPKLALLLQQCRFEGLHWYCDRCVGPVKAILNGNKHPDQGYTKSLSELSENITNELAKFNDRNANYELKIKEMDDKVDKLEARLEENMSNLFERVATKLQVDIPDRVNTHIEKTVDVKMESYNKAMNGKMDQYITAIPSEMNKTWTSLFDGKNNTTKSSEHSAPTTNFRELLKEEMENQKREETERERKMNNIVLYRVKESDKENGEDRKREDLEFFNGLCMSIEVGPKAVKNALRLGSRKTGIEQRPLKIELEKYVDKEEIMRNLFKLKNSDEKFKKVSVAHDLTGEQMKLVKQKVQEADEKTKQDESSEWSWKVRGPPWDLRIAKVKRQTKQQNGKNSQQTTTVNHQPTPEVSN